MKKIIIFALAFVLALMADIALTIFIATLLLKYIAAPYGLLAAGTFILFVFGIDMVLLNNSAIIVAIGE